MTNRPTFDEILDDWIDSGPTDAPNRLLDGILGAVPTTPQRRTGPFRWAGGSTFALARAAAGIAVVVVLGAAAMLAVLHPAPTGVAGLASSSPTTEPTPTEVSDTGSPTATSAPTAEPTATTAPTAEPTATTAPTAEPTAGVVVCDPSVLVARITGWSGAAGSQIATVTLTNTASTSCTTPSKDRPQLLDGHGLVLVDGAAPGSTTEVSIPAGATLSAMVRVANYCGPSPTAPVTVAFVLGGGRRVVASPLSATDATVPSCNGSTVPANMDMQPWAR